MNLLKRDEKFVWTEAQSKAFAQLRDSLYSEPLPQFLDFTKPFIVTTDAFGYAIGGILSQGTIGKDLPVAYISRLLSKVEQNYSTRERITRHYVQPSIFPTLCYGKKFTLVTDHQPLK
jgi:hypothetical protein